MNSDSLVTALIHHPSSVNSIPPSSATTSNDPESSCPFKDIWELYFSESWDDLDDSMQHAFTQMIDKFVQLFQEDKGLIQQVSVVSFLWYMRYLMC
jgi:hypothetical protein